MNLAELKKGQTATIVAVGGEGALRQHFLDMGVITGSEISYVKAAPMGDPIEYRVWGYELTLRREDAEKIEISYIDEEDKKESVANEGASSDAKKEKQQFNDGSPRIGRDGYISCKTKGRKAKG